MPKHRVWLCGGGAFDGRATEEKTDEVETQLSFKSPRGRDEVYKLVAKFMSVGDGVVEAVYEYVQPEMPS